MIFNLVCVSLLIWYPTISNGNKINQNRDDNIQLLQSVNSNSEPIKLSNDLSKNFQTDKFPNGEIESVSEEVITGNREMKQFLKEFANRIENRMLKLEQSVTNLKLQKGDVSLQNTQLSALPSEYLQNLTSQQSETVKKLQTVLDAQLKLNEEISSLRIANNKTFKIMEEKLDATTGSLTSSQELKSVVQKVFPSTIARAYATSTEASQRKPVVTVIPIRMRSNEQNCKSYYGVRDFIRADEVDSEAELFLAGTDIDGSPLYICKTWGTDQFETREFFGAGNRHSCWTTGATHGYKETRPTKFFLLRKPTKVELEWRNYNPHSNVTGTGFTTFDSEVTNNATPIVFGSELSRTDRFIGLCDKNGAKIPGMITKRRGLAIAVPSWFIVGLELCLKYQVLVCKH